MQYSVKARKLGMPSCKSIAVTLLYLEKPKRALDILYKQKPKFSQSAVS